MKSQSQRLKTKYMTQKCGACIANSLFMKCCKFAKLKLKTDDKAIKTNCVSQGVLKPDCQTGDKTLCSPNDPYRILMSYCLFVTCSTEQSHSNI